MLKSNSGAPFILTSSRDKVRIIALYIMYRDGVPEEDQRRLFQHAKLGISEQDAVRGLVRLGVRLNRVCCTLNCNEYSLMTASIFSRFCFRVGHPDDGVVFAPTVFGVRPLNVPNARWSCDSYPNDDWLLNSNVVLCCSRRAPLTSRGLATLLPTGRPSP
jgi:hypothetical protein